MTVRTVDFRDQNKQHDSAILELWNGGVDTLFIAHELNLPESVVFNRLFHAREAARREGNA